MSVMKGRAWVFSDDVDTDLIYHNKYLAETDPKNMPQYAFEYYPGMENFAKEVKPGDFVVAGKNFGCGSSREHAVYCLQYAGIPCILAETCSRIYYRNAVNNGYPVLFIKGISDAIKKDISDFFIEKKFSLKNEVLLRNITNDIFILLFHSFPFRRLCRFALSQRRGIRERIGRESVFD